MPTYYIDSCEPQDQIQLKHGWFIPYKLVLKNQDGTFEAEILQKPETPAPSGTITGTITSGPYGNKFKKEKREGVTEYVAGKTPEQQKSIVRQHSQHMALIYIALVQKKEPEVTLNREYVNEIVGWFQEDAEA